MYDGRHSRIESPRRRYRVVTENSVLNYYASRDRAVSYLSELAEHSPDTYAEAGIQIRDTEDPYVYHSLSPLCY